MRLSHLDEKQYIIWIPCVCLNYDYVNVIMHTRNVATATPGTPLNYYLIISIFHSDDKRLCMLYSRDSNDVIGWHVLSDSISSGTTAPIYHSIVGTCIIMF